MCESDGMVCSEVKGRVCEGEESLKVMGECMKVKGWCVKLMGWCVKVMCRV